MWRPKGRAAEALIFAVGFAAYIALVSFGQRTNRPGLALFGFGLLFVARVVGRHLR